MGEHCAAIIAEPAVDSTCLCLVRCTKRTRVVSHGRGDIERAGAYRTLGPVIRGGACEVVAIEFRGERSALKWLLADCAKRERVRGAFEHELRLLEACAGSRWPRVIAREEIDGRPAAVLTWVDGEPLEIGGGRAAGASVVVVMDALEALHALHEARDEGGPLGAVHRDVCPANILVDRDGRATVIDLGLASSRWFARAADGLSEGTLGYHSPELFTGEPSVDRRSDVFCAAVVLWELLARRPLFAREKFAAANQCVSEDAPTLASVAAAVDPALDAVIARALARDPAQRYATAREFARALEPFAGRRSET